MRSVVAFGMDSAMPLQQVSLDYIVPSQLVKNLREDRAMSPQLPSRGFVQTAVKNSVKIPGMRALKTAKYHKSNREKNIESILISDQAKLILNLKPKARNTEMT
jgi:hypothetical protein